MNRAAIRTDVENGRATITLARPEVHNAFDERLVDGMLAELKRLAADEEVRVLLLASEGENFCAGADLHWMRRMGGSSFEENRTDALRLAEMLHALARFPRPTVALVQGAAVGGGVGLAACCDIVVAEEEATFRLSEVRLGLIPAVISPYVIAAVGPRAARRYFLTAESFGAAEARRMGLVHEVVEAAELQARGGRFVAALMKNAPQAMARAKELVEEVAGRPIDPLLVADTALLMAQRRASPEAIEGIAAFLENRLPGWAKE